MENIVNNAWLNGSKKIGNNDTELEDRSWYILTILIRIGCPSLPEEISGRCTLFSISPVEVEALCCIPQSPICMTEGHMVSFSEVSIFLFYNASHRFADPLDLVVPDTPVSSSSPSRTCSKGARLYSALQSHTLKGNSHAIQENNPISPRSCDTCTANNILRTDSSTCKDQSLTRFDSAKPIDLPFKYSRKRFRKDLVSTDIGSRSPPKPLKVARSIFPISVKSVEPLPPTEQYCLNPPVEPVNSEVANGANQDKKVDNGDKSHYQLTLDNTSACQFASHHPTIEIAFDILDDSKPNCLLDNSKAKVITNTAIHLQRRGSAILEDVGNKENGIGESLNALLECKSPSRDDCIVHNESDRHGLEIHPLYSYDLVASDCQNKFNLENAIYHKDGTFNLEKINSAVDGKQSNGIKLDLILNSTSESAGQKNSLLLMEDGKPPEICEAKEDGSAGYDRQNIAEPNHHVSDFSVLPVQDPDHFRIQVSEPDARNHNFMDKGNDFICLQQCSPFGDVNLVNEKTFQKESQLAQKNAEEKNNPRCNYDIIANYTDKNISMDNEALNLTKNSPSKMLDTSYGKSMGTMKVILSQEYKNSSCKQKTKGCGKGTAFDKGVTAGDTISSQKQVESRHIPIFKFFTVEEEEGSGGYGTVYKARRKQDAKTFAIKCPFEKTPKTSVKNEILMLQRFGGSNFIIKLEDVAQNNGQDCLVLEYVVHDKPEVLRREIIISELQWYGFCMFKALATLHKQGVIHRDVKPGNFLFSRNINRGYLIDFNLALAGALDGRESNTGHIDIDLVDVKLNESKPLSKEDTKLEDFPDGDGTFNGDVGRKLSGPLDDTPDSIKAEVTCQKGLYVGMIESDSLEPSLGCNFDVNNSWESTGKNKVQNSMLAGVQGGLVQRDNLDTKVFLHNLILPEAEKSGEKEKGEESNKHGKELGEKHFLRDLTKDVSSFIHSLGKSSEPCVAQTTTVFSCSQNAVTSSCLMENVLQEACQMVPEQGADRISGSRGYANSTCITSLSSIGLQRQEVPLHSSNLYSSPHRDSSMPLKRKACFGWLSDDENSPERSDTAMLSNENFGKVKEIDGDAMATSQGICIIEKDSSEKNKECEKNIMHSNEKQISDKFSSEYDCRSIEEDKKRLSDRLFRPWMSLSKDMGDKCNRDKYEQTEAGKSVQKILAKLRHENEINDEVNCKFRKLQMDENIGGSRFIKASHKKQSSHEHETHRSDHRNSRIDGKHLWQLTNNNFSYNEKTSYHSREKYRRSEPRRKYWSSQTIIKQHLEQDISCNQEGNFCEGHYRQEDERNSEQAKIISYNKKDTDNEDHGRKKDKESMHVIGKSSLRHEKKDFQDPKSAHNHRRRNGKVGDKFHSSIALPHTHFRNDHDTLPPKKHCKMSRWDVKPDFMK